MKKRLLGTLVLILMLTSIGLAGPQNIGIKLDNSGMTNQVSCGARGC